MFGYQKDGTNEANEAPVGRLGSHRSGGDATGGGDARDSPGPVVFSVLRRTSPVFF